MAYKDKSKRPRRGTGSKTVSEWSAVLIGNKFGLLTVIKNIGLINHVQRWECVCDCGKTVNRRTEAFKSRPESLSCGCTRAEASRIGSTKHGLHKTKEYNTWHGIKQRCYNKNNHGYALYGGRGITMHEAWFNDFSTFLKDMGFAPDKESSIDRINSNGNYEPSNCRWATKVEQSNNTSRNRFFIIDDIRATMAEHARRLGVSRLLVKGRLTLGWEADEAFKTPKITRLTKCKTTGRIIPSNKVTISN